MYITDALSRLQAQHADPQPCIANDEMTAHVASVITGLPAPDTRLQQIIEAQEEDPVCSQIKTYCSEGWPNKHSVNDAMKPYWSTRGEVTAGLEKTPVWLSGTSGFSLWASNFLSFLARRARTQPSRSSTYLFFSRSLSKIRL